MGGGSYSVDRAVSRSRTMNYASKTSDEIFDKSSIQNAMNPEGIKIRESRDSDEHPESIAIILALDVTGSMGYIPKHMITEGLTKLMGTIIQRGVKDPQILFLAVGDHECDRAPLQVAQFESRDELLDKWLKEVYLEGGGGGNAGESYPLAWYFAGNHTAIDCLEKRDQKGYLFTVGDEPALTEFPQEAIKNLMGDTAVIQQKSVHASEWLKKAREMYHVHHINLRETTSGGRPETFSSWKQLLGEDAHNIAEHENVPNVMADIILRNEDTPVAETYTVEDETNDNENNDEVVL